MNHPADNLPDRDRLADGAGVAMSEEEKQLVARKLQAQTVLISNRADGGDAQGSENMLKSQTGGTGVLVWNGDGPGILTAGHVAGHLGRGQRKSEVVMAIARNQKPAAAVFGVQECFWMPLQGEIMPSSQGLRASHKDLMEVQRARKVHLKGPDIAWIRITPEDACKLERYGGTFHNWRKAEETRDKEIAKQGRQQAGLWVCGSIHEKSKLLEEEREKLTSCAIERQVFRDGPASEPEDGWDRFDYTLELDGHAETGYADWGGAEQDPAVREILHEDPASWGGMSGAGIWDVHMQQVDDRPQCSLVGVVYAEHPPNPNKPELKLRAHGIGSINRVLGRA